MICFFVPAGLGLVLYLIGRSREDGAMMYGGMFLGFIAVLALPIGLLVDAAFES